MATNAEFVTALQGMTVTGVQRHYDEPPAQVTTADLPAAFPTMPEGEKGEYITSCVALTKVRRMSYVILMEATGQSTQAVKYGDLAAVMDNLETALQNLERPTGTLSNFVDYVITTTGNYPVGDQDYWAIVAEVTSREM